MAGERMPVTSNVAERFESGQEVELLEHRAMVYLPEDSVEVLIDATIYEDGEVHHVSKKMTMADIRDAFRKADDGYIDDDDRFTLTDKGLMYLKGLEGERV